MKEVPDAVKNTFEQLRIAYGKYIEMKFLNKRFCVFEATSRYDPERGGPKKITHYLGWITENGIMVPARHRRAEEGSAQADNRAQREMRERRNSRVEGTQGPARLGEHDKNILTALSMNSRIPYSALSKLTGLTQGSLPYRIRKLEERFGIRYSVHLYMQNLGFFAFFIFVKFNDKNALVDIDGLEKVLEGNPRVQLAMLTKGAYDLVIYCLAEDNRILIDIRNYLRDSKPLVNINSSWYISPALDSYGYIPLQDSFFDVLKEKVWHRTKEKPRPSGFDLRLREYALLRELNNNSTISFSEIDRKYGLTPGSAKAAYEKLKKNQAVIIRPTIFMQNLPIKYNGIILLEVNNREEFYAGREKRYRYYVYEPIDVVNRFAYFCDIEDPSGLLYILPVFEEGDLENIEKDLLGLTKYTRSQTLIVTRLLFGKLGYRRFDNQYSRTYEIMMEKGMTSSKERIDYRL